ncbi:MAG: hypothetical protein ACXADB_11650 [Candidatus Hermodarchaeia archaeon]|jgi:hypothetical protein
MSEYLLLTVYRRYLEANGYDVEQKAIIPGGVVDIMAKSEDRTLLAEAKWIRSPGDVYEAVGRSVQNKVAMPEGIPVVVLPTGVASEEIRERILGACYKYGVEIHYVDINKRDVLFDYLTTQIYPAIHSLVQRARDQKASGLSGPQVKALSTLLSSLQAINEPPELVDDVNLILKELI